MSSVVWCQRVGLMQVEGREGGNVINAELKKDILGGKNSNRGEKGKKMRNIYPFVNVLHFISFFPSPTWLM